MNGQSGTEQPSKKIERDNQRLALGNDSLPDAALVRCLSVKREGMIPAAPLEERTAFHLHGIPSSAATGSRG